VRFLVDEVALDDIFEFFGLLPLITIPPLLHTHLSPPHEVCDSPDQAAHYQTLGPKSGAWHLAGLGVKVVYLQGKIIESVIYKTT
jgi:hypothetical protein